MSQSRCFGFDVKCPEAFVEVVAEVLVRSSFPTKCAEVSFDGNTVCRFIPGLENHVVGARP